MICFEVIKEDLKVLQWMDIQHRFDREKQVIVFILLFFQKGARWLY